jgi:hypothetical protein
LFFVLRIDLINNPRRKHDPPPSLSFAILKAKQLMKIDLSGIRGELRKKSPSENVAIKGKL